MMWCKWYKLGATKCAIDVNLILFSAAAPPAGAALPLSIPDTRGTLSSCDDHAYAFWKGKQAPHKGQNIPASVLEARRESEYRQ